MNNFTKASVILAIFALGALAPVSSVFSSASYAVNGLCVGKSQDYGGVFFDVSAGAVNINGSNYNLTATKGLLVENGSITEVYAYKNSVTNKVVIGTLISGSNSDFKNNGILIGSVRAGKDSSSVKFESYVSGCSGYVAASDLQYKKIIALSDTVNTSSNLNVRGEPSVLAGVLGTVNQGSSGVVVGGPVSSGPYKWWQIRYDDSGLVGWSAGDWLSKDISAMPSYFAKTTEPDSDKASQADDKDTSAIEQMASMLEAAKALLGQMEASLKNILK